LLRKWINNDDVGKSRQRDICDSLELIAAESRRCGDLVNNLLTFSRTTPMNLQRTSLNRVIEQALRLIQHQLDLANVQVQLEVDSSLPDVVCDGAQIEQVLLALMMNALDAMPQGGNLRVNMTLQPDENVVRIVIRDDGTGIAPEILPRLFEPFLTTKETGKGVGLGLAISRSILERHGGKIAVQSELGRGTTFTIVLLCEAEDQNHLPVPQIAAAVSGR
jgi:two-component system NtrC family sensor kinase